MSRDLLRIMTNKVYWAQTAPDRVFLPIEMSGSFCSAPMYIHPGASYHVWYGSSPKMGDIRIAAEQNDPVFGNPFTVTMSFPGQRKKKPWRVGASAAGKEAQCRLNRPCDASYPVQKGQTSSIK